MEKAPQPGPLPARQPPDGRDSALEERRRRRIGRRARATHASTGRGNGPRSRRNRADSGAPRTPDPPRLRARGDPRPSTGRGKGRRTAEVDLPGAPTVCPPPTEPAWPKSPPAWRCLELPCRHSGGGRDPRRKPPAGRRRPHDRSSGAGHGWPPARIRRQPCRSRGTRSHLGPGVGKAPRRS